MTPSVELRLISKSFGNIAANNGVNFTLFPGEIHAIVGGNGAGKSTLVKIIYGLLQPDSGTIVINGNPSVFRHPKDAKSARIGMVHQEMLLVENKTVLENIILGSEPARFGAIDWNAAKKKIEMLITPHGLQLEPHKTVQSLTVGERQRILIARLLYEEASILILDEPTSALTPSETETLFSVLMSLKKNGASIIFISHKLPEVMKFSDRISVMRDGKMIETIDKADAENSRIVEIMTGEKLPPVIRSPGKSEQKPEKFEENAVIRIEEISCDWGANPLRELSLSVMAGEIFGVLGVEGNGQIEIETILSDRSKSYTGAILVNGNPLFHKKQKKQKSEHIAYIPSHREKNGIVGSFSVAENFLLGWQRDPKFSNRLFHINDKIAGFVQSSIRDYEITPPGPDLAGREIRTLSGGNQQKIVLSRELSRKPEVLFAFNPTRGIDIKTTRFIHKQVIALADGGCAVLLFLSDIDEAKLLCSRIGILFDGRITKTFEADKLSGGELGLYMLGGK